MSSNMKALILFPDWGYFPLPYRRMIPPLSPSILAQLMKPYAEVTFVDQRLEEIPLEQHFDLVLISAMTNQAATAYTLAKAFRKRGSTVLMGGVHPSLCVQETLEYADAVFIGECEETLPLCIQDFLNGCLQRVYECKNKAQLFSAKVLPDRSIYPGKGYLPIDPIQFFRGCRLACEACSVPRTQGKLVVFRPLDHILADIEQCCNYLFFINDDLYHQRKKIMPILEEMKRMNRFWLGLGSTDMARDDTFLQLMVDSGCWLLYLDFGPRESLAIQQPQRLQGLYRKVKHSVTRFKDAGLKIIGSFTFGFDFDTPAVFERTLAFCGDMGIDEAEFHVLVPYPGSRLRDKLISQNRVLSYDWVDYSATKTVFTPKNMTVAQLEQGYQNSWQHFYNLNNAYNDGFEIESFKAFPAQTPERIRY